MLFMYANLKNSNEGKRLHDTSEHLSAPVSTKIVTLRRMQTAENSSTVQELRGKNSSAKIWIQVQNFQA